MAFRARSADDLFFGKIHVATGTEGFDGFALGQGAEVEYQIVVHYNIVEAIREGSRCCT